MLYAKGIDNRDKNVCLQLCISMLLTFTNCPDDKTLKFDFFVTHTQTLIEFLYQRKSSIWIFKVLHKKIDDDLFRSLE